LNIDKNYFQIAGICDERFAVVIQKKSPKNLEMNKSRPAIVGSGQNSSRISVISKKIKIKSMTIPRISPHISASDNDIFCMDI